MSWQLLSKLGSQVLYFTPTGWDSWNNADSGKGVFSTGHRAVFELYRKASHDEWLKLTLRVLKSDTCPELEQLRKNCRALLARPLRKGRSKHTEGVAFWYRNHKGNSSLNPLPKKTFSNQADFNRWIQSWTDRNPGPWV
jgi:hypothetical protein